MEQVDEMDSASVYAALAEAEKAKRDVLTELATRHAGTPVGYQLERHVKAATDMVKCYEAANREAMRRTQNGELPLRQQQILEAIQDQGGEWSPLRAASYFGTLGIHVTASRGAQVMKRLAGAGYLEPVRPRARTYRLKPTGAESRGV